MRSKAAAKVSVLLLVVAVVCAGLVPAAWAEIRYPVFEQFIDSPKLVINDPNEVYACLNQSQEEIARNIPILMKYAGREMGEKYPGMALVRIDGVPWQESPYADIIWEYLDYWKTGYYATHPELKKILQNPRLNEYAWEVRKLLDQGKTAEEVEAILLGNQADDETSVTPPSPAPTESAIVLYLNRKDYSVSKNGTWQGATMDAAPVVERQRTLIPLRGVMEEFGAKVEWLPEERQIKVRYGDREVVLTLGSTEALVNGQKVSLEMPAKVVNGRTLMPLRFVSEQIGMDVQWDGKTQSITVKQSALTHQS